MKEYEGVREEFYSERKYIMFVYNASDPNGAETLETWFKELQKHSEAGAKQKPILLLVGTHKDKGEVADQDKIDKIVSMKNQKNCWGCRPKCSPKNTGALST